jgi:hypothetical protein
MRAPFSLTALFSSLSLFALALLPHHLCAAQVELTLDDGSVQVGEIDTETPDTISLRQRVPTKSGVMFNVLEIPVARVTKRTVQVPVEEQYRQRLNGVRTAGQRAALATWCREQGLGPQAVEQAKAALAEESTNVQARAVLVGMGMTEVEGKWVVETEWLAQNNLVKRNGKVMPRAEAEALDQAEAAARAAAVAKDRAANLSATERELAGNAQRKTERAKLLETAQAALTKAEAAVAEVQKLKDAVQEAQKEVDRIGGENMARRANYENTDNAAASKAMAELVKAQKAYNAAKGQAGAIAAQAAQYRQQVQQLTAELAALDATRATLEKRRDALQAAGKP